MALDVGNMLSGHSQENPEETIDIVMGIKLTPKQLEKFYSDYLYLKGGIDIISDYGLPALLVIYPQILNATTAEEQLYAVDRALNVVHQRGDIADFFVEGGSATLDAVFKQGTDIPQKPTKIAK